MRGGPLSCPTSVLAFVSSARPPAVSVCLPGFIRQPRLYPSARSGLCGLRQAAQEQGKLAFGRLGFPWRTRSWRPWHFSSLAFTPPQSSCSKLFISEKTNTLVSPPLQAALQASDTMATKRTPGQLQVRPAGDAEWIQV